MSATRTAPPAAGPRHARHRPVEPSTRVLILGCLALATLSLLGPSVPHFDPWAWLVWGREVVQLDLDTAAGASWKPLPVLFTAVFSLFGDAAPALWLVLARAGGLFGLVLAYRLAARFAGAAAGLVAAAALVLTPGDESRWLRLMAQGNIEPLLVALVLWAVERHLDGRKDHAVLLVVLAALARPEVWPFLAVYAAVLWWRDPPMRRLVAVLLPAVPLLWFGGDWWGSGDPFFGAEQAQVVEGPAARMTVALRRAFESVILPVWCGAAVAVAFAIRRRQQAVLVLAAGALAWMALVVVMMVQFGYAALSRFMAPSAAILCVLGGIGAARLVGSISRRPPRLAAAAVLLAASVPFAAPRVGMLATQVELAETQVDIQADLDAAVAEAGGAEAVLACGGLATDLVFVSGLPALAWKLDVPMAEITTDVVPRRGVVIAYRDGDLYRALASLTETGVRRLADNASWGVFAVDCSAG